MGQKLRNHDNYDGRVFVSLASLSFFFPEQKEVSLVLLAYLRAIGSGLMDFMVITSVTSRYTSRVAVVKLILNIFLFQRAVLDSMLHYILCIAVNTLV